MVFLVNICYNIDALGGDGYMVFNKILMKLKRSLQKPLKKLRQNSDSKKNKNKDFSIINYSR